LLLTPQDPFLFRYEHFVSLAYYTAGEFEPAAAFGLRSWHGNPNYTSNLRMTIAALAALGRIEEARPLVERLMMLQPGLRASSIIVRNTYREPEQRAQLAGRLIAAGVPR
jgi:hypothetical protein